jgi:UDP-N-acetylmuramate--alanine ligase
MHNVTNALSAIACCLQDAIPFDRIQEGLGAFHGADRRFQYKGTIDGVTIIDDYAHHPTEIRATLTAAKNYPHDRLVLVFQPHTYSRTEKGTECYYFPSFEEIEQFLLKKCMNGDLLITMGAGNVVEIGEFLLGK